MFLFSIPFGYVDEITLVSTWFRMISTQIISHVIKDFLTFRYPSYFIISTFDHSKYCVWCHMIFYSVVVAFHMTLLTNKLTCPNMMIEN